MLITYNHDLDQATVTFNGTDIITAQQAQGIFDFWKEFRPGEFVLYGLSDSNLAYLDSIGITSLRALRVERRNDIG